MMYNDHQTPREFDACDGSDGTDLDRFGIHRDASPADRPAPLWLILFGLAAVLLAGFMIWRELS